MDKMEEVMRAEPKNIDVSHFEFSAIRKYFLWCDQGEPSRKYSKQIKIFSREGTSWRYLDSFVKERYVNYSKHISKPAPK
jgi:deoxyribodipyrimidine photo-lyase